MTNSDNGSAESSVESTGSSVSSTGRNGSSKPVTGKPASKFAAHIANGGLKGFGAGDGTPGDVQGDALEEPVDGAALLDELEVWFGRYISVVFDGDLALLALWAVHTHLARQLYSTPRLRIDSAVPGSGKTTVLDHLSRLCYYPIQAATIGSPALLARVVADDPRTILLDEVDRSLRPDKPGVQDLLAVLNSGYRVGGTRPVLEQTAGGQWEAKEMSTFAPVAMAGNAPDLPEDTRSREIRILLMPDLGGTIEDSDWEFIEVQAKELHDKIAAFASQAKEQLFQMRVDLPAKCVGRQKEKWRPLKRLAVVVGGRWPNIADSLIERALAADEAERDAGLKTLPPGVVLLQDLYKLWPDHDDLVPTSELVSKLAKHNPDYWGLLSNYGKALTEHRFGRLVLQVTSQTSQRPGGRGHRGFFRSQFEQAWHRLGVTQSPSDASGASGSSGASGETDTKTHDPHRMHRSNGLHRPDAKDGTEWEQQVFEILKTGSASRTSEIPGGVTESTPGMGPAVYRALAKGKAACAASGQLNGTEPTTTPGPSDV